jgi:sensor histidine kinase YesM
MQYDSLEVKDTKIIRFITEDRYRILRHIILLAGLLAVLIYSKDVVEYQGSVRYIKVLFVFIPIVAVFYINMNILVPLLFFKGRYWLYLGVLIVLTFITLMFITSITERFFPGAITADNHQLFRGVIMLIAVILVTTMIKLFQRWMRDSQKIIELNSIRMQMELNELKNQLNPHFLFNMLNSIKSLVRTDSEKATQVIMKLSELLRYQLYENNEQKALLRSEINFLSNFLDLETLRRDNLSTDIKLNANGGSTGSIFLPPNLFTTFVENAVKHSVDTAARDSFVKVTIELGKDRLYFSCLNSKDPGYRPSKMFKSNGLGLTNIKRRLELLYGEDHILEIESTETQYEVKLTIPL